MRLIILLVLFLLLSANAVGSAKSNDFAYEFKQTSRLYGPSDFVLDGDRAKVDVPNLEVQFIFVEALDKVQIVNVKQHTTATIALHPRASTFQPTHTAPGRRRAPPRCRADSVAIWQDIA